MRKAFFILSLAIAVAVSGCDPTDFELPAYQANFFVPVLDVELNIEDLILADTNDIIRTDSSTLVILGYNYSETKTLEEIVEFDDQEESFTIPGIPSEFPDIEVNLPLTAENLGLQPGFYESLPPQDFDREVQVRIEEFVRAEFVEGSVDLTLTNDLPLALDQGLLIQLINQGESVPFAEFSYDGVINSGDTIQFDSEDLASKSLTGDFTLKIQDLSTPGGSNVTIDSTDALLFAVSLKSIKFKSAVFRSPPEIDPIFLNIPLIFSSGALLTKVAIDSAKIAVEIPKLRENEFLRITLLSATQDGEPVLFDLRNQNLEDEFANVIIDLAETNPPYNILRTKIELLFNESVGEVEIIFDESKEGTILVSDIDYGYQEGYMGTYFEVFREKIDFELFDQVLSGSIQFDDPRVTVSLSNGAGAEGAIFDDGQGLFIKGANDRLFPGDTVAIGEVLNGFTIPAATSQGNPQTSSFTLDKENEPNFSAFLALLPTWLDLRTPFLGGTDSIDFGQFISGSDEIGVDFELELPMFISADNLIVSDTSDYNFDDSSDNYDIQSAVFNSRLENYFPLELPLFDSSSEFRGQWLTNSSILINTSCLNNPEFIK